MPLPSPSCTKIFNSNKEVRFVNKNQYFSAILEQARKLAKVFKGKVITEKSFSICKGNNSIRFNCQNEHNFYLQADILGSLDIEAIKKVYKDYRLCLETIIEANDTKKNI